MSHELPQNRDIEKLSNKIQCTLIHKVQQNKSTSKRQPKQPLAMQIYYHKNN